MSKLKKISFFLALVAGVIVFFCIFLLNRVSKVETRSFGVTFSKIQTERLGLDWQEVYKSLFEDFRITKVRVPVYWPEAEPAAGQFDFSAVDWMMDVAEQYNAEIILAVGRKLPRWPECHEPEWAQPQNSNLKAQSLLNYIKTTIERYNERKVVWAWQIENEPYLDFGECPDYDKNFLDEEISWVRSLTNKPIIITDGGEFGDWFRAYKRADIFGSTMYRHIYNERLGEITYPIPAFYFRLKRSLVELFLKDKPAIVIELQIEPWGEKYLEHMSFEEQYRLFGPERFEDMMEYAKNSGFDTFYLWGAEWWYRLKEQGYPEMWELVKNAIGKLKQS